MEKKRFLVRAAWAALVVIAAAASGTVVEHLGDTLKESRIEKVWNERIKKVNTEFQVYLNQTANRIAEIPVDPVLRGEIAAEVLKRVPVTRVYLWMSDTEGKLVFGAPQNVFDMLTQAYARYKTVIESDAYYIDQNDFFRKLVLHHQEVDFDQFESGVIARSNSEAFQRRSDNFQWRFYREYRDVSRHSPLVIELSAPVLNRERQSIGMLHLKVSDQSLTTELEHLGRNPFLNDIVFPACRILLVVGLLVLWFLLPSWVYLDARQRNVRNAGRWALLTVVSFGFAWLIWLIARPTEMTSFHCPQCARELNGTRSFCPHCGHDLSSTFCPQCQYPVKPDWQFCPSCRFDLTKPQREGDDADETKSTEETEDPGNGGQ